MSSKGLARVSSLFGQVERVRLVELQQASAAVLEVEQAQALAAQIMVLRRAEGRVALASGDTQNWLMAVSACAAAERAGERVEELRLARASVRDSVGEHYRTSRLQTERVSRVVEAMQDAERLCDERREQAQADDRYGARLHWTQMKAG